MSRGIAYLSHDSYSDLRRWFDAHSPMLSNFPHAAEEMDIVAKEWRSKGRALVRYVGHIARVHDDGHRDSPRTVEFDWTAPAPPSTTVDAMWPYECTSTREMIPHIFEGSAGLQAAC